MDAIRASQQAGFELIPVIPEAASLRVTRQSARSARAYWQQSRNYNCRGTFPQSGQLFDLVREPGIEEQEGEHHKTAQAVWLPSGQVTFRSGFVSGRVQTEAKRQIVHMCHQHRRKCLWIKMADRFQRTLGRTVTPEAVLSGCLCITHFTSPL